jgi:hypothetical protein
MQGRRTEWERETKRFLLAVVGLMIPYEDRGKRVEKCSLRTFA